MNGAKSYRRWLRRTIAGAVLAAGAAWSCFALVENRQQTWAAEMQQGPVSFHPGSHVVSLDNFFAGLR